MNMFESIGLTIEEREEIIDKYDASFLKEIIENKELFLQNYEIFMKHDFSNYINDIVLRYLPIFIIEPCVLEGKIIELINVHGNNYVDIISKNMELLEVLLW